MSHSSVKIRRGDDDALERFLAERIYEYNSRATGYFDGESFSAAQRDDAGAIVAGISGFTWGGCCFISYLWVAESLRGTGMGRALLAAAELDAVAKGCTISFLSTHSFQSPGFYERMGYVARAVIADYPVGFSDTFYSKRL